MIQQPGQVAGDFNPSPRLASRLAEARELPGRCWSANPQRRDGRGGQRAASPENADVGLRRPAFVAVMEAADLR